MNEENDVAILLSNFASKIDGEKMIMKAKVLTQK